MDNSWNLVNQFLYCVDLFYFISVFIFFFKQKTAYEIKECDWSSDVCSSDLNELFKTRELMEWDGAIDQLRILLSAYEDRKFLADIVALNLRYRERIAMLRPDRKSDETKIELERLREDRKSVV